MTGKKQTLDITKKIDAIQNSGGNKMSPDDYRHYMDKAAQVKKYEAAVNIAAGAAEVAKAGIEAVNQYNELRKEREQTRQMEINAACEMNKSDADLQRARMEHEETMKKMETSEKHQASTVGMLKNLNGLMERVIDPQKPDADSDSDFERAMQIVEQFHGLLKTAQNKEG